MFDAVRLLEEEREDQKQVTWLNVKPVSQVQHLL